VGMADTGEVEVELEWLGARVVEPEVAPVGLEAVDWETVHSETGARGGAVKAREEKGRVVEETAEEGTAAQRVEVGKAAVARAVVG
jgi:hypothetical protein